MTQAQINPRKTPKQARAKASVEAILQGAAHILQTGGLDHLTTNRVAEVAGVSIGTLYQYFPSKDAILTQLIREKRALLLQELQAATASMQSEAFDDTLAKLLHAAVSSQLHFPKLSKTLEYVENYLPLAQETNTLNAQINDTIVAFLTHHGIGNPEVAARDLVFALRGMIDGASLSGETDVQALYLRARRLAKGYLF
ncbi:TetR/AcrR family transcriptional regulator [Pseudosulfitobacter sp. DSM 107133]|uniref:TetR/AcrR family transcriptional regulator n=1 Tax=Pseudosulfitobacter sp. DSM 107133 TaxID=2883100 RepID=UPI000DF1BEAE|nr:TetR/AcrR family transcriptional regulator [Pseudosulfitobacter sp. DSM 107133]UOA25675.1 Nucleoid occlusion factor SlmA [Pseudosulfitobacter sp. DSM 107133]